MSTETKYFGALVLFIGLIVVLTVGYDIYRYPASPDAIGEAKVLVEGTGHFDGEIGSERGDTYTISGNAPFSASVPYKAADYVFADIERDSGGAVKILLSRDKKKDKVVEEGSGSTFLMWDAPRRSP